MSPYKNPEDAKAQAKRYYWANRQKCLAKDKEYVLKNREKVRTYQAEWRAKNCEKRATYQKKYQREYYGKHREELLKKRRERYYKRHEEEIEKSRKNRRDHPEKVHAQILAWYHIPLGSKCEICGSTENLERHHPDYSKPLEVMTVCHSCHMKIHHNSL